ncbi:unnamed protein product [Mytilus coruscus]|uniref:Uncharacterized protein n=1 Tax=Mytilus coruscus TaxID=42192 RepID=A0A6J8BN71_MYTCO|nr:unnamed protein product [Mytilus coruscus]
MGRRKNDENVAGSTDTLLTTPDFFETNERNLVYSFAPAENNQPISIFTEKTAKEQAYPGIFCGQARIPNDQRTVPVSYGEKVKSELRDLHPVGNVIDWFSRIKFQQRGLPHVHMMIWCDNAPNLNYDSNEEICKYIDKFITCSIQNADASLTTLVKLQQHKHSRTCKKGEKV